MSAILEQLHLDSSFFVELAIFFFVFLILSRGFFRPYLKLFEARHRKTVEDREAAEKLTLDAQAKFDEYKLKLGEERAAARKEYEAVLEMARKEESALVAKAREEAKKITQETAEAVGKQREDLRKQLEVDVEIMARNISERLISRKV